MRYMQNKQYVRFEESIVKVKYPNKINQSKFLDVGNYPIVSQEERLISGYWNDEHDVFWNPTAVVIFGDHTRVLKYIDFDFVVGADGIKILKPIDQLNAKYFYYQLLSFNIDAIGYARHYRLLKEKTIKIPPLAEQQRIVARLDAAFAAIDEASAAAEANLRNARALFDSYLDQVFSTRGAGWVERRLGDVCNYKSGGTPSKQIPSYWIGSIPWVSAKDLKTDEIYDTQLHISEDAVHSSSTTIAHKNTILILVRGMGLANGVPLAITRQNVAFNQDIKMLDCTDDSLDVNFLFIALKYALAHKSILSVAGHGTLKIDTSELLDVHIKFPPSTEQLHLVSQYKEINHHTTQLTSIYQQKLTLLTELKQALLAEEFGGV